MVVKGLSDVHGGLAFVHEVYRCTTADAVTVIQKHIAGDLLQVHTHCTLIPHYHYIH